LTICNTTSVSFIVMKLCLW